MSIESPLCALPPCSSAPAWASDLRSPARDLAGDALQEHHGAGTSRRCEASPAKSRAGERRSLAHAGAEVYGGRAHYGEFLLTCFKPHCNQPCNLQLLQLIALVFYSPVSLRSDAKRCKPTPSGRCPGRPCSTSEELGTPRSAINFAICSCYEFYRQLHLSDNFLWLSKTCFPDDMMLVRSPGHVPS